MRYGSLICSKKWLTERPNWRGMFFKAGWNNSTRVMWKQELLQPLWLSLGCFSEVFRLSYLIWKRGLRATCWYENQDCNLTDRYFMIIFWYSPGSTKEVTFKWLFFLSNELKIVISFIKQFKTHDITTYIKEIVIQFSACTSNSPIQNKACLVYWLHYCCNLLKQITLVCILWKLWMSLFHKCWFQ